MSAPAPVADVAADQRQILGDLAAEYGRQLRQILQVGELIKGSVYQIETRCGNPGCHCATPRGQLHPATVLSWSEAGRTRMRSLGVDQRARVRRLSEQYRRLRQARADVVPRRHGKQTDDQTILLIRRRCPSSKTSQCTTA